MTPDLHHCPACESALIKKDFYKEPAKNFLDVQNQTIQLSLCKSCGFIFQNPIIDSMQSVDHYVNHSSYILDQTKQMHLAKENQFSWIKKSAANSGFLHLLASNHHSTSLFEIGASVGSLLKIAKDHGWGVAGVEPAPEAVSFCKNNYGIQLQLGGLESVEKIVDPIITMIHVFEHIPAPIAVLKRLHAISPENAFLAIEVPDITFPRNSGGTGFFVAEHVNYFTAHSIVQCALKAGWQLSGVEDHNYTDAPEFCMYPVLRATFIKRSENGLLQQMQNSVNLISETLSLQSDQLKRKLQNFIDKHKKVVLFGAGWHTVMLLELMSDLNKESIAAIVDSNPERAGSKIQNISVSSSLNLEAYRGMGFVVSSQGYQDQIVEQIQSQLGKDCAILTFY